MLRVEESAIHDKGLFTTDACAKDVPLFRVEGPLMTEAEAERSEREQSNYYIYRLGEDRYIDASGHPLARYVNHSCAANLGTAVIDGALYLVPARDIAAGEELTLDYEYAEIYELCRCGFCAPKGDNG